MSIGRRNFILGSISGIWLTSFVAACSSTPPSDGAPDGKTTTKPNLGAMPAAPQTFTHGVASGDPLADRVILWTRVTADGAGPFTVTWVVATDPALAHVVQSGEATATAERDFTVKVDATGLSAGTTYYYAFALDKMGRSAVGRTRTLPSGDVARVRFAFTSCANYNNGHFNAYRAIARRSDLDVWVHLGDYIYEYADMVYGDAAVARPLEPKNETVTLDDYRKRYAHYRSDPDLRELHRQHPLIAVWDDHETANDAWKGGAQNHGEGEGDWEARKRAGTQAFVEWLPIRVADATLPPTIYRSFPFGNLFDLIMIDTRLAGRDKQIGSTDIVNGAKGTPAEWADPGRSLLGLPQEEWLKGQLAASKKRGATWRLLGNQVMFAPARDPRDGAILATDIWDGYQATRTRIVDHIAANAVDNLVVLTGDIHTSWAFDVAMSPYDAATYDPATGRGSIAVEFVGPSVTSLGLETNSLADSAPGLLTGANPHLKFSNVTRKGYVLVDITKERVQGEWYFVKDHKTRTDEEELAVAFTCASGAAHLEKTATPTSARADAPAPAP